MCESSEVHADCRRSNTTGNGQWQEAKEDSWDRRPWAPSSSPWSHSGVVRLGGSSKARPSKPTRRPGSSRTSEKTLPDHWGCQKVHFPRRQRFFYGEQDRSKIKSRRWTRGIVVGQQGPMVTIDTPKGIARVNQSKVRLARNPWHDVMKLLGTTLKG